MSNFWDVMLLILSSFVFFAYLIVMFQVVVDLFRDSTMGGGSRVLWIIGLIVLPFLTALLYILTRGRGMTERQRSAVQQSQSDAEAYIRQVAGKSPASQIAEAKALLDAGTIYAGRVREAQGQGAGLTPASGTSSGEPPQRGAGMIAIRVNGRALVVRNVRSIRRRSIGAPRAAALRLIT